MRNSKQETRTPHHDSNGFSFFLYLTPYHLIFDDDDNYIFMTFDEENVLMRLWQMMAVKLWDTKKNISKNLKLHWCVLFLYISDYTFIKTYFNDFTYFIYEMSLALRVLVISATLNVMWLWNHPLVGLEPTHTFLYNVIEKWALSGIRTHILTKE